MSILEVTDLSMSYADMPLYTQASFVLNKEEHMGVIGQNGAGKSILIRLLTGQTLPDEGQIKWQPGKKIGYLDQYVKVAHDLTIGDFLQSAFKKLHEIEAKQAKRYADQAITLDEVLLVKADKYQEQLEAADFYTLDVKIAQAMTGLGIDTLGKER